jgi:Na+-transporting methylmalonyl-CoA/oxaloacetate decarboxylase gamma subunit
MTGLGIVLTILTLIIILLRIKAEVKRNRFSTKGGIILGLVFALSLASIVSVSLLTSEGSLGIRLPVLGLCIVLVFLSYKFAKRSPPMNTKGNTVDNSYMKR